MKVQINRATLQAKVMTAWKAGLFGLTSEILADCNEYVKRDIGTLENSSLIHSDLNEGIIRWETPYARRQYWEIKTSLTPGRTWRWFETAKRRHLGRWQQLADKGVNDNL